MPPDHRSAGAREHRSPREQFKIDKDVLFQQDKGKKTHRRNTAQLEHSEEVWETGLE